MSKQTMQDFIEESQKQLAIALLQNSDPKLPKINAKTEVYGQGRKYTVETTVSRIKETVL